MIQTGAGTTSAASGSDKQGVVLALALAAALEFATIIGLISGFVVAVSGTSLPQAILSGGGAFVAVATLGITIVRVALRR